MNNVCIFCAATIMLTFPIFATAQPWHVEGDTQVDQTVIQFESDETLLEGTLYYPAGAHKKPALVVAHGSGTPERDSWLFQHLIEGMPGLGVAVFVFDRRGTGESGGEVESASFYDLADDILAAADAIGAHGAVDRNEVGVWGQSQGGWLAMEAAARGEISFVINIAGPMVTPAQQMYFAVQNAMILGGFDQVAVEQAVSARRAVDDWVRGDMNRSELEPILDDVEGAAWVERALGVPKAEQLPDDPSTRPWARDMDYDPVLALRTLEENATPVLIIYGGADAVIPVQQSLNVLNAFKGREANWLDVRVIEGADHILMFPDNPDFLDSSAVERVLNSRGPESVQYFMIMGAWLEKHLHRSTEIVNLP